jgi:hypothetical protein
MAAIQVVNFFKQGLTGAAYEALTIGTGDPTAFAVVPAGTVSWLADLRAVNDDNPLEVSVVAFGFHDQTLGILGWVPSGATTAPTGRATTISPPGMDQPIIGGNTPTVNVLGTAGDNSNVTMIIYHSDLPGSSQNLIDAAACKALTKNILGVDVVLDLDNAQGDWSPPVALDAATTRLDAARRYALLGFTSNVPVAAVGVLGFETSGLKVGGPVLADGDHDASLIYDLDMLYHPAGGMIPVFSGSNQSNIFVYGADPTQTDAKITVQLADLTGPT